MTALLVASAGGHLSQLMALRSPIDATDTLWATYDTGQSRSLLAGEQVVHAHHPTTKKPVNAVRNYRLARRVFAEHDIDRVISTGAAVSVPFMFRAHQLGIPCHYIESATRVTGPSLSGRMLERLRGVHLYRQLGDWGEPRWRQGPSVFDSYTPRASAEARVIKRVVVSLGTHHYPFPTLVEQLETCFRGSGAQVLWQLGSTPAPSGLEGEVVEQLPADELQHAIADADVVVGHAGVGLTLTALSGGTVPVLVPRRRSRREHTDDHQVQLADALTERGLAIGVEVGELSVEHLERAARLVVHRDEPPPFALDDTR